MIRALLLDLGDALVRESDRTLFPHVRPALRTIAGFETADGSPLEWCLASNFPAQVPVPPAQAAAAVRQVVGILERAGLADLFQPADRRVTISAAVGVAKPNRAFFEGALTRLGLPPTLATCLFISEDADHVARAAALGMHTLRFGGHTSPADATADFTDWAVAPAMVAARLAPGPTPAMTAAVRVFLETTLGLSVSAVTPPAGDGDPFRADARTPSPLSDPALGELAGVHVSLPVRPAVWVSPAGRVTRVEGTDPSAADLAEATLYVQSLASNGQVEAVAGESPLGPTHAVETDAQGLRTLTRKRFTAY